MRAAIAVLLVAGCRGEAPPTAVPAPAARSDHGYLKGALHVHTSNSGDSETPPADVARWYHAHGFDFIVLTDHNVVSVLDAPPDGLLVIPGVELTQNLETCDPPPADGDACLLHVNALFVAATATRGLALRPLPDPAPRLDVYRRALGASRELGGVAQLNHPNFHWGADAALIEQLVRDDGLRLFEVANQSSDVGNDGDATHPSTAAIWDAVLGDGGTLYGTATDDAHQYDDADAMRAAGGTPDVGDRGWVMVRAPRDAAAIRDALVRGDFYASTGVALQRAELHDGALVVELADETPGDAEIAFIGRGGRVLARTRGRAARFPLARLGAGDYVRATITDGAGHTAWVQPVRR